jgi:hypothetical protein
MVRIVALLLLFSCAFKASQVLAKTEGSAGLFVRSFTEDSSTSEIYSFDGDFKFNKKLNKRWGLTLHPHISVRNEENSENQSFFLRGNDTGLYFKKDKKNIISIGLQTHQFGLSQLFSPLNIVDTASYWAPLEPLPIGSPSIRWMYKTKKLRAFFSYLPYRFENLYPGTTSQWIPNQAPDNLTVGSNTLIFDEDIEYEIRDSIDLNNALTNNFVAGLSYDSKPFMIQAMIYDGMNVDPNVFLNLDLNLVDGTPGQEVLSVNNPISVIPLYQRVQRAAWGLRYTLPFKWRIVYEGSFTNSPEAGNISSDPLLNTQAQEFTGHLHTLGLEWGIPVGDTLIVGVIQGFYSERTNQSSLGFVSPFQEAYLYGLNWDLKKLQLQAGYLDSVSLDVQVITASLSFESFKDLKHSFTYTDLVLGGELEELISGLFNKDNIIFSTTYKF